MRHRPRPWLLLPLLLVAAAVVPHAWLSEVCPPFASVFTPFCALVGARGGHLLIFAAVGGALLAAVPALRREIVAYLLIVACVGLVQEGAQLWWKARASGFDEVHDLGLDLLAATAVWSGWWAAARVRKGLARVRVVGRGDTPGRERSP